MKICRLSAILVISLLYSASSILAESNRNGISQSAAQCANTLQECFSFEGTPQANCFYSVSRHHFCEGTQLGRLIFKRWAMSPLRLTGTGESSPLTTSQQASQRCLGEVDSQWSHLVSNGDYSEQTLTGIGASLDTCLAATQLELPRP